MYKSYLDQKYPSVSMTLFLNPKYVSLYKKGGWSRGLLFYTCLKIQSCIVIVHNKNSDNK